MPSRKFTAATTVIMIHVSSVNFPSFASFFFLRDVRADFGWFAFGIVLLSALFSFPRCEVGAAWTQ